MSPLAAILVRDMRIAIRVGGGALMGVLFFLVVVTLVPLALGPDLALLKRIGPAILWLAALLASLLALDRLFAAVPIFMAAATNPWGARRSRSSLR